MYYYETDQKKILHELEEELLAMVAVDMDSGDYEVIYSDGAYRNYKNRYHGRAFFDAWNKTGLKLVFEPDRARMRREISEAYLRARLEKHDSWITQCRFYAKERPVWCRVKVKRNVIEPGTILIGIRNVDEVYRRELSRDRYIAHTKKKELYIRTFGMFTVFRRGEPVPLRGKAKEILALLVTRRGREVGNEEIYRTIWEERSYSNDSMTVYYNAIRRLKHTLSNESLEALLISTPHGQLVNTELFDCDYYEWLDGKTDAENRFEGEFLSEYSWGEYILAGMVSQYVEM